MGWVKGVNMGKMIFKKRKYSKMDKHMKLPVIIRWKNIKKWREYILLIKKEEFIHKFSSIFTN